MLTKRYGTLIMVIRMDPCWQQYQWHASRQGQACLLTVSEVILKGQLRRVKDYAPRSIFLVAPLALIMLANYVPDPWRQHQTPPNRKSSSVDAQFLYGHLVCFVPGGYVAARPVGSLLTRYEFPRNIRSRRGGWQTISLLERNSPWPWFVRLAGPGRRACLSLGSGTYVFHTRSTARNKCSSMKTICA